MRSFVGLLDPTYRLLNVRKHVQEGGLLVRNQLRWITGPRVTNAGVMQC